jgi:hypothetical protein
LVYERWQMLDRGFVRGQIDADVHDARHAIQSPRHVSHAATARHSGDSQDRRVDFGFLAFALFHTLLTHPGRVHYTCPAASTVGVARVRDFRHLIGEIPQPIRDGVLGRSGVLDLLDRVGRSSGVSRAESLNPSCIGRG